MSFSVANFAPESSLKNLALCKATDESLLNIKLFMVAIERSIPFLLLFLLSLANFIFENQPTSLE